MAPLLRVGDRALHHRKSDTTVAEWRLDGERAEQQRPGLPDPHRRQPHRAHQQRADARGKRQRQIVPDAFTDTEGGAGIAAGAEGALVQPFDRHGVVGRFRQDSDGEIVHA